MKYWAWAYMGAALIGFILPIIVRLLGIRNPASKTFFFGGAPSRSAISSAGVAGGIHAFSVAWTNYGVISSMGIEPWIVMISGLLLAFCAFEDVMVVSGIMSSLSHIRQKRKKPETSEKERADARSKNRSSNSNQ